MDATAHQHYVASHPPSTYNEERILIIISTIAPRPPATRDEYVEAVNRLNGQSPFIFDYNRDGRITFDEFLDLQWARLLWFHRSGDGRVSIEDAVRAVHGPYDLHASAKENELRRAGTETYVRSLDRSSKGYITRDDLRGQAWANFKFVDRRGRGYITQEDMDHTRVGR